MQLLEVSFHSLTLVNSRELPYIHIENVHQPQCIVLGTSLDKMLETGRFLSERMHIFVQFWIDLVIIKHLTSKNEVIFPVNTTATGDSELKMAARICNIICNYYIEAQIPIRWFLFQLELNLFHESIMRGRLRMGWMVTLWSLLI